MKILFALFLILSNFAFAYTTADVTLIGAIKSFSDSVVQVVSSNGTIYEVPRSMILLPDLKQDQKISIKMTDAQFAALKRTPSKKK